MKANQAAGELLTAHQVSAELGVAVQTLANWRHMRRGPEFTKTSPGKGGSVRYRRSDVEKWLDRNTVHTK